MSKKPPAERIAAKRTVNPPSAPPVAPAPPPGTRVTIVKDESPIAKAALNATKTVEGADAVKSGKDIVPVSCPNSFNMTLQDHSLVHYPAGTTKMPREHAEHWYAVNNGVEIIK